MGTVQQNIEAGAEFQQHVAAMWAATDRLRTLMIDRDDPSKVYESVVEVATFSTKAAQAMYVLLTPAAHDNGG